MIYCAWSSFSGFFTMQYFAGSMVVVGFGVVVVVVVEVVVVVVVVALVVVVVACVVVSTTGSEIWATSFGPTVCSDMVVMGLSSWLSWKCDSNYLSSR